MVHYGFEPQLHTKCAQILRYPREKIQFEFYTEGSDFLIFNMSHIFDTDCTVQIDPHMCWERLACS